MPFSGSPVWELRNGQEYRQAQPWRRLYIGLALVPNLHLTLLARPLCQAVSTPNGHGETGAEPGAAWVGGDDRAVSWLHGSRHPGCCLSLSRQLGCGWQYDLGTHRRVVPVVALRRRLPHVGLARILQVLSLMRERQRIRFAGYDAGLLGLLLRGS